MAEQQENTTKSFEVRCNEAGVGDAFKVGLGALEGEDRKRIKPAETRKLDGIIALDEHFAKDQPQASRWDYGIGYAGQVYWVEVHPAITSEVKAVLKKRDWLLAWLASKGQALRDNPPKLFWVATGKLGILPNSPQGRKLGKSGLQYPIASLELPPPPKS